MQYAGVHIHVCLCGVVIRLADSSGLIKLAVLQAHGTGGLKRRHCNITETSTTLHIRLIYNISSYLGGSLQVAVNRVYMQAKHFPHNRLLGRRKPPPDVISSTS